MKYLFKYFKGYKIRAILAPVFKMLEAIFELLVPLTVTKIIDVGIKENDEKIVVYMCLIMLLLGIVGLICAICAQYFAAKTAVDVSTKIRSSLFAHIQKFSYSDTDRLGASTLITRMSGDINSVQTGINMFLRLFMRSPFIVFGAIIMAFTISPRLSLIFIVTIPLLAIVVFGIMLISIPIFKKTQSHLDSILGKVRSNYNGTKVVRAFNKENDEIQDFDEKNNTLTKIQLFAGRISALMNPLTYAIINIAVIVLVKLGAFSVNDGEISQGELVALYNYLSQILVELIKLASLIITLNKAAASASRISDTFNLNPEQKPVNVPKSTDDGSIVSFQNVSFKYSPYGDNAISNISFKVEKGQTIGIIGGTGSGKSTLMNLIPGFYYPTEGNVFVEGINTAFMSAEELCSLVGIVPQKARLFKGDIRSNLKWGKHDAEDNIMWETLELVQAKDFIVQKQGLDTEVEAGGSNFSGGQKQRLSIARTLIKKPRILILDDSASALDYETEAKLRSAIKSLDYSPTVFIVSQRASSILHADKIIVMEDGEIVGIGRHEELIEKCEVYKDIYLSQIPEGGNA